MMEPATVEDVLRMEDAPALRRSIIHKMTINIQDDGTMAIKLCQGTKLYMTVDKGFCIDCYKLGVCIAVDASGTESSIVHPCARLIQTNEQIQLEAMDWSVSPNPELSRHAKMSTKGITFSYTRYGQLAFLVDTGGVRTTRELFRSLQLEQIIRMIFTNGSRFGKKLKEEARFLGNNSTLHVNEQNCTDTWLVNGLSITRNSEGKVSLKRGDVEIIIHISGMKAGDITVTNSIYHCTMSFHSGGHIFVRQDQKRIHYDGELFSVRNASHSVTMDSCNHIKIV